jgi:hypothetical protein
MVSTLLSNPLIIPPIPLTLEVTPAKINFKVVNMKNPPAHDAAIGNPTSAINLKISDIFYNG